MCEIFQMGAHTLCWYGGRFVCEPCQGKHCFVINFILRICNFLNSVNILFAFCVNYSPPQIRNTCEPN